MRFLFYSTLQNETQSRKESRGKRVDSRVRLASSRLASTRGMISGHWETQARLVRTKETKARRADLARSSLRNPREEDQSRKNESFLLTRTLGSNPMSLTHDRWCNLSIQLMAAIRDHCRLTDSVSHGYRCRLGASNEVSC